MATVPYSQWVPFVLVELPACPRPLIIEAVRQSAIQFCQESGFWRKELDGFYTVATDAEYELTPPPDSTIAQILTLKVGSCPLVPKTLDDIETMYAKWREQSGKPEYFFLRDSQTAVFVPIPDSSAYEVRVLVTLKPSQAAHGVDECVFEEYKDAVKHGAIAYLANIPEKDWTDPNKAAYSHALFMDGIRKANNRAQHGYSLRKTFRVKPHYI